MVVSVRVSTFPLENLITFNLLAASLTEASKIAKCLYAFDRELLSRGQLFHCSCIGTDDRMWSSNTTCKSIQTKAVSPQKIRLYLVLELTEPLAGIYCIGFISFFCFVLFFPKGIISWHLKKNNLFDFLFLNSSTYKLTSNWKTNNNNNKERKVRKLKDNKIKFFMTQTLLFFSSSLIH